MSGVERRRLFCAVLFHCAAALCVIWSLCVLIERAAEEVKRGQIGWPFWTKLVVVTVGLTGGVVFMYIQCRQYLHLCNRWRARNRYIIPLYNNTCDAWLTRDFSFFFSSYSLQNPVDSECTGEGASVVAAITSDGRASYTSPDATQQQHIDNEYGQRYWQQQLQSPASRSNCRQYRKQSVELWTRLDAGRLQSIVV